MNWIWQNLPALPVVLAHQDVLFHPGLVLLGPLSLPENQFSLALSYEYFFKLLLPVFLIHLAPLSLAHVKKKILQIYRNFKTNVSKFKKIYLSSQVYPFVHVYQAYL